MNVLDYIVVGQGLAGTLLGHQLESRGKSFVIFDKGHSGASSSIAAGIINPITGRRFVKSWMFDLVVPDALRNYRELESRLQISILKEINIIRSLPDQTAENDWNAKSAIPEYGKHMVFPADNSDFRNHLILDGYWSEVRGSYQVDIPALISSYRSYISQRNFLREEYFSNSEVQIHDGNIHYRDIQAKHLILCEGAAVSGNTTLKSTWLNPSKGEILRLRIPGFHPSKLFKRKYFLAPLRDGTFWFGAKDGWHFDDDLPSSEGDRLLKKHAAQMITVPYEVLEHVAAIRPTVNDRRPVVGPHPTIDHAFILNGFGTKGASLAPYWSSRLIALIEEGRPIEKEVELKRFGN